MKKKEILGFNQEFYIRKQMNKEHDVKDEKSKINQRYRNNSLGTKGRFKTVIFTESSKKAQVWSDSVT